MSNVDVVRDAPSLPQNAPDPNVKIPDSVLRAAARANQYYTKEGPPNPQTPQPITNDIPTVATAPQPVVQPVTEPAPEPAPAPEPQPVQQVAPEPQPVVQPVTEPAPQPHVTEEQWEHRYHAMKGRYDQSQRTLGAMQEQLQELGDELVRTQQLITRQPPATPQNQQTPPRKLVTEEDVQNYGPDLLNLVQRAAVEAVSPELDQVKQENSQLRQTLTDQQKAAVHQILDVQVPNWRQINRDPRFLRWLSLRDLYSGGVRGQLLNDAFNAAQAPRVVAFFKGFLSEEQVTGHIEAPQPASAAPQAPRAAAVQLSSLAAPGRAKPAGGDTPLYAADKPIFTRAQIVQFYRDVREQRYSGREQDKARIEADIFSAQREGRVR